MVDMIMIDLLDVFLSVIVFGLVLFVENLLRRIFLGVVVMIWIMFFFFVVGVVGLLGLIGSRG